MQIFQLIILFVLCLIRCLYYQITQIPATRSPQVLIILFKQCENLQQKLWYIFDVLIYMIYIFISVYVYMCIYSRLNLNTTKAEIFFWKRQLITFGTDTDISPQARSKHRVNSATKIFCSYKNDFRADYKTMNDMKIR